MAYSQEFAALFKHPEYGQAITVLTNSLFQATCGFSKEDLDALPVCLSVTFCDTGKHMQHYNQSLYNHWLSDIDGNVKALESAVTQAITDSNNVSERTMDIKLRIVEAATSAVIRRHI